MYRRVRINLAIVKNILISRFYKRFLRNGQNLGHFGSSKKFRILLFCKIVYYNPLSTVQYFTSHFLKSRFDSPMPTI